MVKNGLCANLKRMEFTGRFGFQFSIQVALPSLCNISILYSLVVGRRSFPHDQERLHVISPPYQNNVLLIKKQRATTTVTKRRIQSAKC